jgi:hypothetical protein
LAVLAGEADPVDDDEQTTAIVGAAHAAEDVHASAQVALWWAREFAALGSRRDAVRCVRAAWRGLSASGRAAALLATMRRPAPQAVWA